LIWQDDFIAKLVRKIGTCKGSRFENPVRFAEGLLAMLIAIVTSIRLIGEGIAAALRTCDSDFVPQILDDIKQLRGLMKISAKPCAAIIDVTQSMALEPIKDFHADYPDLPLVALGVKEREQEVIAHGAAGFIGYLRREDGLDQLQNRIEDALSGRLLCSPEIAAGIMRGLFQRSMRSSIAPSANLTAREGQVAVMVSRGMSNKEIANELELSESTVKHHVHAILGKLQCGSRFQMVREARNDVWGHMTTRWEARG
jgi:two-component system, NarL family, nitrate/nitrite response regulator NarL